MAVALEIRVRDLLLKFLADALVLLRPLQPAGAVAAGTLQALPNGSDHFLIFIQPNRHTFAHPFSFYYMILLTLVKPMR